MRILHITASMNPAQGGLSACIRSLTPALEALGHPSEIVCLDDPSSTFLKAIPAPVHALGPARFGYAYSAKLLPWLKNEARRFDAVIVHGLWQYHGMAMHRVLAVAGFPPVFVFPHGMLDPWFQRQYPRKHIKKLFYWWLVERRILQDATTVLFTCEEERRLARNSFPNSHYRERVVLFGTAAPAEEPERQREAWFQQHPEFRHESYWLFLGRIHPKKGVDLLIDAYGQLAAKERNLPRLVMAGPCSDPLYLQQLQSRAETSCPTGSILWPGMLEGAVKWGALRAAEAFVLPSHQENFGIAVAEALACGTPVLISNQVNIWREIISDGVGLAEPDTAEGTIKLLRRWFDRDRSADQTLRLAARETFHQRYEIGAVARSWRPRCRRSLQRPHDSLRLGPLIHDDLFADLAIREVRGYPFCRGDRLSSNSPMKIAIVQGAFLPVPPLRGGAVEKVWLALGQEFVRCGHEVTHYSRLSDGLPATEIIAGVRHRRVTGSDMPGFLPAVKWHDLLYTRRVAKVLAPADIVVTNTFWAPLVFSPHRHGPIWVHVQRYPKGQMRLYRRAACLQTVSRVIADAMIRQAPSMRDRIRIIPNPLPPLVAIDPPVVRDPNLVLFVGRIHPEKGLALLIDAACLARQVAPNLVFRIVGPSETRFGGGGVEFQRELEQRVAQSGARVEFVGPVFKENVLAAHFASAAVFVYPSLAAKGEASPVAPLEALARGCPVVTSDLACFDDTIGQGSFANRFDHEAPDAANLLLQTLMRVVSNRADWQIASAAAQGRAREFEVARVAQDYLVGFHSLMNSK